MRNQILCEVFQMLPDDDEDELPFREIDENSIGGQIIEGPEGTPAGGGVPTIDELSTFDAETFEEIVSE
jgi:hypothetical protein